MDDTEISEIRQILKSIYGYKSPSVIGGTRIDVGEGYSSTIYSVTLDWPSADVSDGKDLPGEMVVKVPSLDKLATDFDKVFGSKHKLVKSPTYRRESTRIVHENECNFYKMSVKQSLCNTFKMPKYFGCQLIDLAAKKHGFLAVESFFGKAGTPDLLEGLNLNQTLTLVENLAELHAFCINNTEWKKVIAPISHHWLHDLQAMGQGALKATKRYECFKSKLSDGQILSMFFPNRMKKLSEVQNNQFIPVIAHGDFWGNNTLFAMDENGKVGDNLQAIIDFQNCHIGTVGVDLARLLSSSLSTTYRRNHFDEIIDHYYAKLKTLTDVNGIGLTRQTIFVAYREAFPFMTAIMLAQTFGMLAGTYKNIGDDDKNLFVSRSVANITDALQYLCD